MNPTIKEVSAITLTSACNWNPPPRSAMISITGTGEGRVVLKRGWRHVLRVTFDDIEKTQFGLKLFSDKDADKVIDFIDRIEGKVDHVVIHCRFGQSRSPAIARYISQRYDLSNGFGNHMTFNRHVFATTFRRWKHRVAPGEGFCINMGWARADDPIYTRGPIVAGREILKPYRKWTAEDRERNFQIARDAIAKGNQKPTENN